MTYQFEVFGSDKYASYAALFEREGNRVDEKTFARRRWWCFDNPNGGAFAVATHGGKVVATCYVGGKRLNLNSDRDIAAFEIGETATDPDHQRKGLFSKLVNACSQYAFEHGFQAVYGTPNRQSTPGYAKLGYEILSSPDSWLLLIVNAGYRMHLGLPRVTFNRPAVARLTAREYIDETVGYCRLNRTSIGYLTWRLADCPSDYSFYRTTTADGRFFCAVKEGRLGKHPVLVCAEYFLEGVKPPTNQAASLLRLTCADRDDYRRYAGIHFHASAVVGAKRLGLLARGIIPHRQLPVCIKNPGESIEIDFKRFQLSDCDIG